MIHMSYSLIEKYFQYLPIKHKENIVSLAEGNTPLVELTSLMTLLNDQYRIFAKIEGFNPTGSFKDRGMTVAISQAKEAGARAIMCASTGNTSASAAAYAAKAKMKAFVLLPSGKIAHGKLAQAIMYGAEIIQIEGNFDDAMTLVKALSQKLPIALVNSVNPHRLAGQKTAAFEVIETLSDAPDYHALPVGNAGNISAYWMGYKEFFYLKKSKKLPKMLGYQAEGAAPFIHNKPITAPETLATAIRIGNPQSWELAQQAAIGSAGWFAGISDEEILAAQRLLARVEGIFCEPASAISIAGLFKDIHFGKIEKGSTIVCTLTGNGLKDPEVVMKHHQSSIVTLNPQVHTIQDHLEKNI